MPIKKSTSLSLIAFLFLFSSTSLAIAETATSVDVFQIKRNKNRNIVQYAVYLDETDCRPGREEAAHVFWRDIEIGPTEVNKIKWYEKPAYGIESQALVDEGLQVRLEPLPERLITVQFEPSPAGCKLTPYVAINGDRSRLDEIYVFAREGLIWPTVQWIEIRGTDLQGQAVEERIYQDQE